MAVYAVVSSIFLACLYLSPREQKRASCEKAEQKANGDGKANPVATRPSGDS